MYVLRAYINYLFLKSFYGKDDKKIIFHFILHIYLESDFHEKSKLWA